MLMRLKVKAEVCTVRDAGHGAHHVLCKSLSWVVGFTTSFPPSVGSLVSLDGERPDGEPNREVFDAVMAHPRVGIAPRARNQYRYAELTDATWEAVPGDARDLWRRPVRLRQETPGFGPLPKRPPGA